MSAESDYMWCYEIISSCKSRFHFEAGYLLIDLFRKKYPSNSGMAKTLIDLINDIYLETYKTTHHD